MDCHQVNSNSSGKSKTHSPKQRTLVRSAGDGSLKIGVQSAPQLKRTMPAFQYKSLITILQKALRITTQHGIKVTAFIECPTVAGTGELASRRPPPVLVASPVAGEDFSRYFSEVLMPGALAVSRDDRYYTQNVLQRVEEVLQARADGTATEEVQVETLFVSPETVQFTQRGTDGQHPILITPYHRLANI